MSIPDNLSSSIRPCQPSGLSPTVTSFVGLETVSSLMGTVAVPAAAGGMNGGCLDDWGMTYLHLQHPTAGI